MIGTKPFMPIGWVRLFDEFGEESYPAGTVYVPINKIDAVMTRSDYSSDVLVGGECFHDTRDVRELLQEIKDVQEWKTQDLMDTVLAWIERFGGWRDLSKKLRMLSGR